MNEVFPAVTTWQMFMQLPALVWLRKFRIRFLPVLCTDRFLVLLYRQVLTWLVSILRRYRLLLLQARTLVLGSMVETNPPRMAFAA